MSLETETVHWRCMSFVLVFSLVGWLVYGKWYLCLKRFFFRTHTSVFNELKYFSDTSSGIPWTNADGWWKRTISKTDNWKINNAENAILYRGRGIPSNVLTSLGISVARWGGLYSEVCFKSSYKSLTMRTEKNLRMWNSTPSSVWNVSTPGTYE